MIILGGDKMWTYLLGNWVEILISIATGVAGTLIYSFLKIIILKLKKYKQDKNSRLWELHILYRKGYFSCKVQKIKSL